MRKAPLCGKWTSTFPALGVEPPGGSAVRGLDASRGRCGGRAVVSTAQGVKELRPDRRAPARARVPAGLGGVAAVVARRDVPECVLPDDRAVQERVEEAHRV